MSEEINQSQISLKLSGKNYTDQSDIFGELISTYPNIEILDLSENNLNTLPLDLSSFSLLHTWDLRCNPFVNFEEIVASLSTLPSLINLKINLVDESQVKLILGQLHNLEQLNGKSTKEEVQPYSGMIDLHDDEVKNICWQNEISSFNEIFKKISEKLKHTELKDRLKEEFQVLIKSEISKINSSVDSVPNYIYAASVLESQLSIYSFFNEKYIDFINGKDSDIGTWGSLINESMMKSYWLLIKIIYKLYPVINDKTSVLKRQLDEVLKSNQCVNNEITGYESKVKQYSSDKDVLIQQYQEEVNMWHSRIETLENENRIMTEKMLKNAKDIINYNSNWNMNWNYHESAISNNIIPENNTYGWNRKQSKEKININKPHQHNGYNSNQQLFLNNNNNNNNNSTMISSPICTRVFTIKMMKDVINEIYTNKAEFDKKSDENKLPRETLEQYMYTYLNQKYGLKPIIIEWASNIINGIKVFSGEDSEVSVFGKILRNEMDEDSRFMYSKLKERVTEFIVYCLKAKYPLKGTQDIQDMKNLRINGFLVEDEWKKIINAWYESPDSNFLENKIIDVIQRKYLKSKFDTDKKMTREEIIVLSHIKEEYNIPFRDWMKILHEFQVKMKEKFSRNFVILFKRFDSDNNGIINEEEFINMIYSLNYYGERIKENVVRLLTLIDPNNNKQITFSQCASLFTNEILYDEQGNNQGSWMNKICWDECLNNN